jgi:hypothetical protein
MAIGDLYEATTHVRTAEGEMQFSFGYLMEAGVIGPQSLDQACTDFAAVRLNTYVLAVSDNIEVDKVEFKAITNNVDIPGFVNFNNLEGLLVGAAVPNNSAAVLSLLTTAPNSKHNGRMYIPGLREIDQQDGSIDVAALILLNVFGTTLELDLLLGGAETAEFTPVVISRILDGVKRTPPVGHNLVSAIARTTTKQQRRRGGRRFGLST